MKTLLTTDGQFGEVIDLRDYLSEGHLEKIQELYRICGWPFEPPDAWIWKFEDVCALYFRVRRHADMFQPDPDHAQLLYAIEKAIRDCQEDEFS